jgi:hypothetical protein
VTPAGQEAPAPYSIALTCRDEPQAPAGAARAGLGGPPMSIAPKQTENGPGAVTPGSPFRAATRESARPTSKLSQAGSDRQEKRSRRLDPGAWFAVTDAEIIFGVVVCADPAMFGPARALPR